MSHPPPRQAVRPEAWLLDAAKTGKLAPERLHAAAATVLESTPDKLWPKVKPA